MPCTRVVGVAEDVVQQNINDTERLLYYIPDEGPPPMRARQSIRIRFAGDDPSAQIETVRRALQRVMPAPGYVTVSRLEDVVDNQRRSWTLGAMMFVAFGALRCSSPRWAARRHWVQRVAADARAGRFAIALGAQRAISFGWSSHRRSALSPSA